MQTRSSARRLAAASTALVLAAGSALLVAAPAAAAPPFEVTSLDDSGPGTLRQAIADANAQDGADEIVFASGLSGVITLDDEIDIDDALTITGPGVGVITITHDDTFNLFEVNIPEGDLKVTGLAFEGREGDEVDGRAFDIHAVAGDVTFEHVTFTRFETGGDGGAARIDGVGGDVTLTSVTAQFNSSGTDGGAFFFGSDFDPGGIEGAILLDTVHLASNWSDESGGGAHFDILPGPVTIVNSVIEHNETGSRGGGLRFYDIANGVSITDTTIKYNVAVDDDEDSSGEGGGVQFEYADGVNSLTRVAFIENGSAVGAGVYVWSSRIEESAGDSFTVTGSTFQGNAAYAGAGFGWSGGGSDPTDGRQLVVDSSTFWQNVVLEPGQSGGLPIGVSMFIAGLRTGESAQIVNSTFDERSDESAGLYAIVAEAGNDVVVEVLHSTVVGPGAVLLISRWAEPDGAALLSHDILVSTADRDALGAVVVVNDENDEGPQPARGEFAPMAGAFDAGDWSLTAGPLLAEVGYTLEWSVVSTGVEPGFVATGPGTQLNTDPELEGLAGNGGLTPTMLLGGDSPALNAGDPEVSGAPEFDQRGSGFSRVVSTIDIGAVEMAASTPTEPTLPATGAVVSWPWAAGAAVALLFGMVLVAGRRSRRFAR